MGEVILYKRKIGDRIIDYRMELDDSRVCISDYNTLNSTATCGDTSEILKRFPHLAPQIRDGAKFELTPDGKLKVVYIPEAQKEAHKFFAGQDVKFPGSEQLRVEFESRKTALGEEECKGCGYGKLLREYLPRVVAAIRSRDVQKNTNSRAQA